MNPSTTRSSNRNASLLARWLSRLLLICSAGLAMAPASAFASWWNHDWSYRKQITLDASPKGAAIAGDLNEVPVLIRLHDGVLKFSDLNADGSDLRFVADDDKTPLKFHVEKYDSVFNLAFVWVQVPVLKSAAPTSIWMYYGNANATNASDARGTYDANQTLVYHFGERGTPPQDSSSFANNAQSPFALDESGLIGNSAKFDGNNVVTLPLSSSLTTAAAAPNTWSAWIKPTAEGSDAVIYAQHDSGRSLQIGLTKGAAYVSVSGEAGAQSSTPSSPLSAGSWHHLALLATASGMTLYVDGQAGQTLALPMPALAGGAVLGGDVLNAGAPVQSGFKGEIDELEIAKVARDPALIKLFAGNQGTEDKLVQFGGDEAQSTWSSGYFGIIMKSVTLDGWVVIGILFAMAVTSWIVMYSKGSYTSRVNRANDLFTEQFRTISNDVTNLESAQKMTDAERAKLEESTLHRMYQVGRKEILHRFQVQGHSSALSAESIESIRAAIDATLVRENQRLSKNMVLLTIAISGAPFLGLLGTVVGVMITFAAIAAAGDVNVNAIAPGISAALLATVAGMAVAIPALFGYNYLLGRVKDIQANMTVFVDEFVTLMAEMYPASTYAHQANLRNQQH